MEYEREEKNKFYGDSSKGRFEQVAFHGITPTHTQTDGLFFFFFFLPPFHSTRAERI